MGTESYASLRVDPELRRKLKMRAATRGVSLKALIESTLTALADGGEDFVDEVDAERTERDPALIAMAQGASAERPAEHREAPAPIAVGPRAGAGVGQASQGKGAPSGTAPLHEENRRPNCPPGCTEPTRRLANGRWSCRKHD